MSKAKTMISNEMCEIHKTADFHLNASIRGNGDWRLSRKTYEMRTFHAFQLEMRAFPFEMRHRKALTRFSNFLVLTFIYLLFIYSSTIYITVTQISIPVGC